MSGCSGCSFKGLSTAVEDSFVGVRFHEETNLTLCATQGAIYAQGDRVLVEVDKGLAYGRVERSPMTVFKPCQKTSAKKVTRRATAQDDQAYDRQMSNQVQGKLFCQQRSSKLGLEMKVSRVDFSLDARHATFYFTANGRVDFRQLVRDLAQRFKVRVKMVQIGARDEAALLGGIGICGETLCCSTWLKEFQPISISMAKRQNLSLNPSKISGQCGRLLCCLAYENDQYERPARQRKPSSQPRSKNPAILRGEPRKRRSGDGARRGSKRAGRS